MRRELLDKCLPWPEDVIECLPPLGILKDGCEERLMAAMDGAEPPPKDVPAGPAPAWTMTLEDTPRHVAVTSDGTVLVVGAGLMGVRDGEIAWRKDGDFAAWLLPLPGELLTWVGGAEDRVVAFDPTDGSERWSVSLSPVAPDDEDGEPGMRAALKVAAPLGDGLLVGDATARFFRVDPAPCAPARGGKGATGPVPHRRWSAPRRGARQRRSAVHRRRRRAPAVGERRAPRLLARAHEPVTRGPGDEGQRLGDADDRPPA